MDNYKIVQNHQLRIRKNTKLMLTLRSNSMKSKNQKWQKVLMNLSLIFYYHNREVRLLQKNLNVLKAKFRN